MKKIIAFIIVIVHCSSCSKTTTDSSYTPTPQALEIPLLFEQLILPPEIPFNNPQTTEGIALGKKLFFETLLSGDNSQSCASCHLPEKAFSENTQFSEGITGEMGHRNAMPLFNLAWNYDEKFFWDGREFSLEHQALAPVENPIEMNASWESVVAELQAHSEYPEMFQQAFDKTVITPELVTKALAQFERTLISGNAKFDQYLRGETTLTAQETEGFNVFMDETKGDCFHCHGSNNNPLWTDNDFHNNGLDATFTDLGLGAVTGDPADNGKFKTPSLRNLAFTAPYMHDGRFNTLNQVIHFYSEGLQNSPTIDPLMKKVSQGGVQLSPQEKMALKAFLLTLSDTTFINNPDFQE